VPQIPVVGGPTVESKPLPTPYRSSATPEGAFGETIADAGMRVGISLTVHSNALKRAQDVADATRVNAEEANFTSGLGLFLDEALKTKGQDAVGVTPKTMDLVDVFAKETTKQLANDNQRNLMVPKIQEWMSNARSSLSRHENGQMQQLSVDSANASIASASDLASKLWTQPEVLETSLKTVAASVNSIADAQGWSPEKRAQEVADKTSATYSSILATMDAQGAHAAFVKFYQDHEGELTASDREKFSKVYQKTSDEAQIYATADAIYKANSSFVNGKLVRLSEQAAYDSANQSPPEIRKDVVQEVNRMVAEAKESDNTRRVNLDRTAWQLFERGGVKSIPMTIQTEMDGNVLQQMKDHERVQASAGPEPFDWDVYGRYEAQLPADRLKKGNTALDMLLGKVPRSVLKEKIDEETVARDYQAGLRTSGAEVKGPSLDTQGIAGVIAVAIQENADLFDSWSSDPSDRTASNVLKGKFAAFVRAETAAFQTREKRNPDYTEAQAIIDKGLIEGQRPAGIFGWFPSDVRAFERRPGDVFPVDTSPAVPDIPATDRASIAAKLAAGGYAVTEENIRKQYEYEHGGTP